MSSDFPRHSALNIQDALSRNALLQPFGDGLGGDPDSESESSLASEDIDDSSQRLIDHAANVHCQLMFVNWDLIAPWSGHQHNQPMLDMPQPDAYPKFSLWLKAVCEKERGMQRRIAEAAGVSPQAVTKWLDGGNIEPGQLKPLAAFVQVDYGKLRLLLDGEKPETPSPNQKLQTRSEMGAIVGRKWEELIEPAQSQVLNLLETILTLQRDSYRKYTANQTELIKKRSKVKA